jgi:hypothetical protein
MDTLSCKLASKYAIFTARSASSAARASISDIMFQMKQIRLENLGKRLGEFEITTSKSSVHSWVCTYLLTHSFIHSPIHSHTHTYIHTYTYIQAGFMAQ